MEKARSICFSWTLKKDVLRFVCKINHLMYDVAILDNNRKETAFCLIPLPDSKCVSNIPNGHISQNVVTNTTVLTIWNVDDDSSYDGYWTCRHGAGKGQAVAEVALVFDECKYTAKQILTNCTALGSQL